MIKKINSLTIKLLSLILVLSLMQPAFASAAKVEDTVQPYASNYLSSYTTYICDMGGGDIQIWWEVMGIGYMDELGTLSITLYESTDNSNWTPVKTFLHENYSQMLSKNDYFHCDYVSYQGNSSRYYKAYVCIWAGKNGNGDTRYMWATE